jgi:hypothetical protein
MSATKLTETQQIVLCAAVRRADRCVMLPPRLKGAAAQRVVKKLVDLGLIALNRTERHLLALVPNIGRELPVSSEALRPAKPRVFVKPREISVSVGLRGGGSSLLRTRLPDSREFSSPTKIVNE